ncbi:MAG TPA: ferritin-like domain-containing protein [Terrimicrobiaceae bacterium]
MDAKENFVSWLRDAYAMEKALVDTLKKHAADAKGHPEIREPIEEHCELTETHAEQIETLLEEIGEDTSTLKTAMARLTGLVTGLPTSMVDDTLLKNALAEFTSENFEIACYTSLIAAAEELGFDDAVVILEQIRNEEQDMADLLIEAIPEITTMYLSHAQKT